MPKKRRSKPPSRARYEETHPTVSARVTREVYERLEMLRETEGKSFADILKVGLGILEANVRDRGAVWEEAYAEGWGDGLTNGWETWGVTYRCCVCGETMMVETEMEKAAIARCMKREGWGHAKCLGRG